MEKAFDMIGFFLLEFRVYFTLKIMQYENRSKS